MRGPFACWRRGTGENLHVRVFSETPFTWQVRAYPSGAFSSIGDGAPVYTSSGALVPTEGQYDFTAGISSTYPTAPHLLVITPVYNGYPQDGEEDYQPDRRTFYQII
jgi:hypothetical protein